jgi:hypothetical protein
MPTRQRYSRLGLFGLLLWVAVAQAQQYLQLGAHSYSRAPAPALQMGVSRGTAFFLAVGGVAFESVATGRDGIKVASLGYDATRNDCDRLLIGIKQPNGTVRNARAHICDWQLVPIARFAESDNGSAMTLFGKLDDKQFEDHVLKRDGRIINYHPAFDNTLVGLRLMQADIMLFDENAVDLPRSSQGYVLGSGESQPDIFKNTQRFNAIQGYLAGQKQLGRTYRSYVTGDLGQKVEFYVDEGFIKFTGLPYWHMWDDPPEVRRAYDEIDSLRGATNDRAVAVFGSLEKVDLAVQRDLRILKSWKDRGSPIVSDTELSDGVSAKVAAVGGINPTIYRNLANVMHYSALFRHYKSTHRMSYVVFVASMEHVSLTPNVMTPTVQQDNLH